MLGNLSCYVLECCLLSDATMQTDGLSATPHINANTLVAISLMSLAAVQHYYVRDNVHVQRSFFIVTSCYSGRRRKSIVGAKELQFSDGL
jgi:hypothetical protein